MRKIVTACLPMLVVATGIAATPAVARPHRTQVCHREHRHGHPIRVCHWRR